jgi:DNA-directed RNA polymerase, mitochondrial
MKKKTTPSEFDRSIKPLMDAEDHRSRTTGFGTTKQGQELARQNRQQLADRIRADRTNGRRVKAAWGALKGLDDQTIALRLLVAGISVAEPNGPGVDDDGQKNFRDQALWIGRNFNQRGDLGLKVGAWGIDMLTSLEAFGLDVGDVLKMTARVDEIMDDVIVNGVKNNPLLSPLTTPPKPWTQVRNGGLPDDHWAKEGVSLIREHHPSIEAAARKAIATRRMQPVLDAVNVLQRVAFTINEPLLDFVLRDGQPPAPEGPLPPVWQQKRRQKWNEAKAQRTAFDTDMVVADAMAAAGCFWVPLNIDFRGRIYGVPHFNFQREDHVRSLFLFADGEPIGEEKAHVAGTAGGKPRKLGHYDRIKWTDANLEKLCAVGRAVLRRDDPATIDWALPKDRYQFLAACVELAQAIDEGPTFKTRLPLMFDGSCSGLQHLCAMTRAEEGKYVNLSDHFETDDFYTRVANGVWDAAPELRHLMQSRDDRDIVKRPAMSYFYGSEPGGFAKSQDGRWHPFGMTKQIIEVLKERRKNSTEGAKELAHAIYDAIGDMVPRAKAVRDFLGKLAEPCAKAGKPLRWTTQAGLQVFNIYHEAETERIPVYLNGRRRRVKFVVGDKQEIDETKVVNAVTANFVHSIDATHLQAVAIDAARAGIEMACIHDCFGSLAPRARRLKTEIIPLKFVQLHRYDLLADVLASARATLPKNTKLPSPPETGTLKLERIYLNYHAFKN